MMTKSLRWLRGSYKYRHASPAMKLDLMLQYKSFKELLSEGLILNVQSLADKTGYTPAHVRHLCRAEALPCIKRGMVKEEVQYFFLPEQALALFSVQKIKN